VYESPSVRRVEDRHAALLGTPITGLVGGAEHGRMFRLVARNGRLHGLTSDGLGVPHIFAYRIEKQVS
jgi:hypothetical protein